MVSKMFGDFMKKFFALLVLMLFVFSLPVGARTKYDKYGHIITSKKKTAVKKTSQTQISAAAKEKVKVKDVEDGRGRSLGKAVREGDTNNFTLYNQRGRKLGNYVEDENGNGKYYDLRGREIRVNRRTQDIE